MDETEVKTKKIETKLNQKKIDYINYAYNEKMLEKSCFGESFKRQRRKSFVSRFC